jgi:HSP20 family protein
MAKTATPVEVKKAAPARTPDVWQSFRSEMDRLFDRFSGGFGIPAFRRWFDTEPAWTYQSSFSFPLPAVDVTEDDKAYKITAELPGLEEKDINVNVTGGMLTIKGEKSYGRTRRTRTVTCPSAPTARSGARSRCPRASMLTRSPPIWRRAC